MSDNKNTQDEAWDDWEEAADAGLEPSGLNEVIPEEPKKLTTKPKKVEIVNNLNDHTKYVEPIRVLLRPKKNLENEVPQAVSKPTVPEQKDFSQRMAEYEKAKERIFKLDK